jgi:hypothetical protein
MAAALAHVLLAFNPLALAGGLKPCTIAVNGVSNMIEAELKALSDLAEYVLMAWLADENPTDKHRQQALALLADAGVMSFNPKLNLANGDNCNIED